MYLSVCLSFSASFSQSLSLSFSVYLPLFLSVSVSVSVRMSLSLFLHLYVSPCLCLPVLSICLSVCLSPSLCVFQILSFLYLCFPVALSISSSFPHLCCSGNNGSHYFHPHKRHPLLPSSFLPHFRPSLLLSLHP